MISSGWLYDVLERAWRLTSPVVDKPAPQALTRIKPLLEPRPTPDTHYYMPRAFLSPLIPLPREAVKAAIAAYINVPFHKANGDIIVRDDSPLIPHMEAGIRAFLKAVVSHTDV